MLRIATNHDSESLAELLSVESLRMSDMDVNRCGTWILDEEGIKGFFSLRMEHNLPYLVHLCVQRESRSPQVLWRMARYFKEVIHAFGYKKAIINTPKGDNYLSRLVSRYFKVRPYADDGVVQFYLVEV